jgi:hypothetical protein
MRRRNNVPTDWNLIRDMMAAVIDCCEQIEAADPEGVAFEYPVKRHAHRLANETATSVQNAAGDRVQNEKDGVLIAPVSRQVPCYRGILRFWSLRSHFRCTKPLSCSHFSRNSLSNLIGKKLQVTDDFYRLTGYFRVHFLHT